LEPAKEENQSDLDLAYEEMSLDTEREAKALEWIEALYKEINLIKIEAEN